MTSDRTDEILSVRLPVGTKAKLKAASGANPSKLVRLMISGFLEQAERERLSMLNKQVTMARSAGASEASEPATDATD